MGAVRKKSCLGCDAYEFPHHRWTDKGHCALGYKTEPIEGVTGFYGKGKQIICCELKPIEPCPKPRTCKAFLELWRQRRDYLYAPAKVEKS